jgi:hypothetical protein
MHEDFKIINWHDSNIVKVIELAEKHELVLYLSMDVSKLCDGSKYELKTVTFYEVYEYNTAEGAIIGGPTILDYRITKSEDTYIIVFETTAGHRTIKSRCEYINIKSAQL